MSAHGGYADGILPGLLITGAGSGLISGPAMNRRRSPATRRPVWSGRRWP